MTMTWDDVELPKSDLVTKLTSINSQIWFSSTLYWINWARYDSLSELVRGNTPLRWIVRLRKDAFIALNHNVQDRDRGNSSTDGFCDWNR